MKDSTTVTDRIAAAVYESIHSDTIFPVDATPAEVEAWGEAHGYQTDHVAIEAWSEEGEPRPGYVQVDIWGWTEQTPANEEDWRLTLEHARD